jgi:hypothetical protein
MKKLQYLFILIVIVFRGFATNAFGQTDIYGNKANQITIDGKGGIYNHDGTQLGYVTKDDIVKNNKGEKLYFIDRSGNVINAKGRKIGMAKKNGAYYNNEGHTVLQLKNPDAEMCEILDPQGHGLGYVHCFFLQREKDKAAMKM